MNKRYFKEVFREVDSGHSVTIHKGGIYYIGCIDTYRVTGFCPTLDDCLSKSRDILSEIPDWLRKLIG